MKLANKIMRLAIRPHRPAITNSLPALERGSTACSAVGGRQTGFSSILFVVLSIVKGSIVSKAPLSVNFAASRRPAGLDQVGVAVINCTHDTHRRPQRGRPDGI